MKAEDRNSPMNKEYLGDGVYAEIDRDCDRNWYVKLTTSDGLSDTNTIYLEPEVVAALQSYLKSIGSTL